MVNKNFLLKKTSCERIIQILKNYNAVEINTLPMTEKDLYNYYEKYTDRLISFIREATNDNVFPLGNEMRAMFGHISDYRSDFSQKKNLKDAYGHFRRLNIDALKILCNEFDDLLLKYFITHYHYDYSNVRNDFIKKYSDKLFEAQKAYLDAQLQEKTGSDSVAGNIIDKYHIAALKYANLLFYLRNNNNGLEYAKWSLLIKIAVDFIIALLGVVLSLAPTIQLF